MVRSALNSRGVHTYEQNTFIVANRIGRRIRSGLASFFYCFIYRGDGGVIICLSVTDEEHVKGINQESKFR